MINNIQNYNIQSLTTSQNTPQQPKFAQNSNPQIVNDKIPNIQSGKDLINNTNSLKELDEIFKKLEGKEGKDFANTAYHELVKYFDIEKNAPKEITWEKNEGRAIVGDYRFYDNSIVFYTDYFMQNNKAEQLATIAHELTHCKQLANMLTTEGLSVEKIAYAYAVSDMRAMLIRNPKIIEMHKKAIAEDKEKEFMQSLIQVGTIKTAKELYAAHSETLKQPKHPLNSLEGIKAQKDWIAQYNYNGADMKVYNACPMEKEARQVEMMISSAYKNRIKG
ncbi:hypothetical protein HDR58_07300 [bacterium]|nr:hypothetical protein [bacterium]